MNEEPRYLLDEANRIFARTINQRVWELLGKGDRAPAEDEEMIHAAHASLYHWLSAGTAVHHQRGDWLVARVYTVLGIPLEALKYAERCLALTNEYPELMADFDRAYAYESVARAQALAGNRQAAKTYRESARVAGEQIADQEDRQIFTADLKGGDWYGL